MRQTRQRRVSSPKIQAGRALRPAKAKLATVKVPKPEATKRPKSGRGVKIPTGRGLV